MKVFERLSLEEFVTSSSFPEISAAPWLAVVPLMPYTPPVVCGIDGTTALLIEKHREKKKSVHIAFLDLEKAFDRVGREVIWYALQNHGVPEELIGWNFDGVPHLCRGTPGLCAFPTLLCCCDGRHFTGSSEASELEREVQASCDRLERFGLKLYVKKDCLGSVIAVDCKLMAEKFGVVPIADKMREARLRWYGHVLRGEEGSVRKFGLNFEVIGKRPRGRPKQRRSTRLHMDLKVAGIRVKLEVRESRGGVVLWPRLEGGSCSSGFWQRILSYYSGF
ncbi:unnamed protein product [Heligmosomoides polygyrus]|uniref:Reverse transcriptase domain-containing protein n=1 Tax=Heligmosomoides polygyrus TaxID=6339 RepID=A0A183GDV2_HELPZ|nr:unnamed protein product [Heligmosomoides polygyrus]